MRRNCKDLVKLGDIVTETMFLPVMFPEMAEKNEIFCCPSYELSENKGSHNFRRSLGKNVFIFTSMN